MDVCILHQHLNIWVCKTTQVVVLLLEWDSSGRIVSDSFPITAGCWRKKMMSSCPNIPNVFLNGSTHFIDINTITKHILKWDAKWLEAPKKKSKMAFLNVSCVTTSGDTEALIRLLLSVFVCYSNLPAKPAEEAQKHRLQYEEMVAHAKKRGESARFLSRSFWRFLSSSTPRPLLLTPPPPLVARL